MCVCVCVCFIKVEAPITNHLRDFAPNLEKYKVLQFFSPVNLLLELKLLSIFEAKTWPIMHHQSLEFAVTTYFEHTPPHFSTQNRGHVSWHYRLPSATIIEVGDSRLVSM